MTRRRIAYLASLDTMPNSPLRRSDAWEHDLMLGMLGLGLYGIDRSIEPVLWDSRSVNFADYEAAVIGTTWDYAERCEEFLARLTEINRTTPVFNSAATVAWNVRKTYLQTLAAHGCPVIPTLWLEHADEAQCRAAFAQFGCQQIVIKPQVGAGAWRQVKLGRDQAWPDAAELPPAACMVQPFLSQVVTEGEYSFFYFDRRFSHAVKKCAAAGDYRVQSTYGGLDQPYTPTALELRAAESCLAHVGAAHVGKAAPDAASAERAQAGARQPCELLYARVDMLRGDDGELKLIELELIEPYLYPVHAPHMGHHFAEAYQAIRRRVG